jgi:pectin methylesterase-like acyl-CoA thioesterase
MKKLFTLLLVSFLLTTKLLAGAVTIQETTGRTAAQMNTDMTDAVSAGNTDITLQFADGGTWGTSVSGGDISIAVPAGVTKLTLYAPSGVTTKPVLYLNTLTYSDALMSGGITFDGVRLITGTANRYLVQPTTATSTPAKVLIQNCWIEGYRAVFYLSTFACTVSELTMTNSIFKNIGVSGILSTGVGPTVGKITISNNTFIDCNSVASAYFIDHRSTGTTTDFTFSNNTVYYSGTQLGNGFLRLAASPSSGVYKFNNNIFATGTSGTVAYKFGYGTYTNIGGTGNYYSSYFSSVTSPSSITFTKYTENSPSNLFKSPGTYDYTISDPDFAGKINAGDSRWFFPATVNISGKNLINLNYNVGSGPSVAQTFSITTLVLRGQVTLMAPADYEISTDNINYTGSLILGGVGNDLTNQTVYVRLKAGLALGNYTESITVSTAQATDILVSCSGAVTNSLAILDTPSGLVASDVSYTGFHTSWYAVTNTSGYTLRVFLNGTAVSTITGIGGISYDVTGLTPGNTYTFAVTAIGDAVNYNNSPESAQSASISTPYIYLFSSVNNSAAGTIIKNPVGISYSPGVSVQLTASKNFGYKFVNWIDSVSGSELSSSNSYTVTMDGTKHIQAVFTTVNTHSYTVNVTGSSWGNVTLSPSPTGGKYEAGTIVSMTAVNDSVSTFLNWEDATTGKPRSIIVDGDKSFTATFSEKSFIVGWDLVTVEPKLSRAADYYSVASNKGLFSAYTSVGTAVGWLTYTAGSVPCALLWTTPFSTSNHSYYQASFSTKGYKNINVHSMMYAYNTSFFPGQKLQYSTNGTNFTDLKKCTLTASAWIPLQATLPDSLQDKSTVYLRWYPDETTIPVVNGNDGTGISNIYIYADSIKVYDSVKPTLISTIPVKGSTGASANGSITLTFDKNVKTGTGNCTLGSTVLNPTFGSKTATFTYTKLAYNTLYTFTIPSGALTNVDGVAFGDTTITFTTMNRPMPTAKLFDAVVAKDGTGDYTTINAAITATPTGRTQPWLIFVKNGVYKGHVDIPSAKPYINLIGQQRDSVVISDSRLCGSSSAYPDSIVYSVNQGATVVVNSSNCYFENITFENKFGYDNVSGPQALALYTLNDRIILNNCWLRSFQDTYLTSYGRVADRHYLKNCRIEGAVDFIYGGGDVFFDKCTIYCTRSAGGYIVAPSHLAATVWGYVFSNCTIDGPSTSYTTYLGRPWSNSPKASFFNTTVKINIYPAGWWDHMGAIPATFADYNTMDAGGNLIDMSGRISKYWYVSGTDTIKGTARNSYTNTEAANYTLNNVLSGSDAWDPVSIVETTENPSNVVYANGTITWNTTPYAISYIILRNSKVIGFTTSTTFTDNAYPVSAVYTVIAVAESGALSGSTTATNGTVTAIKSVESNVFAFFNDKNLVVNNVESGSTVSVYSFNGILLNKQTALGSTVSIPMQQACIVIVTSNMGTKCFKVSK